MHATYAIFPDQDVVRLESETLDPAALQPTEALLTVETSVISAGTELANLTGLDPTVRQPGAWNAYPWRPGYGTVGRVEAVGNAFPWAQPGQRVFCFGRHASRQVYTHIDPYKTIFPVPEDLPPVELVMLRMALIAMTAPQVSGVQPGDTVAIFGLGAVGNLAAQLYQLMGARVMAFDPLPQRCELARRCGITQAMSLPIAEQVQAVRDWTGGKGATITVDAVGQTGIIEQCVKATATFGQVILLGSPRKAATVNITPTFSDIHLRWLSVRGALEWRLPGYESSGRTPSIEANLNQLMRYMQKGELQIQPLISHIIAPDAIPSAYAGLLRQPDTYWGVVIDWRG